jgi:hypothetical protein
LTLLAVALSAYFVEYRVAPIHMCPGSYDYVCAPPSQILFLGQAEIIPAPGTELARYHGRTVAERDLLARHGYTPLFAGISGVVLPALLLIGALLLTFRRSSKHPRPL